MENHLLSIKAAIAALFAALGAFLGWRGVVAVVWVIAMALDYISGTAAACRSHTWSSETARDGLWHKGGMILVVSVSGIADWIMAVICTNLPALEFQWPGMILPLVLAWYIITELGSILENAVKMGAAVPEWLVKLLKIGFEAINKTGENAEK